MKTVLLVLLFIVFNVAKAQVAVKDEPRHAVVFENKFVRILDVRIMPGDTSLYHRHQTPSVFLCFTETLLGNQELGKNPTESRSHKGSAWYRSFTDTPQIHRVWNRDTVPFHVTDIEILTPKPGPVSKKIEHPEVELIADEERARIYKIFLSAKSTCALKLCRSPFILSFVDRDVEVIIEKGAKSNLPNGKCLWINDKQKLAIRNKENERVLGYLFEVK